MSMASEEGDYYQNRGSGGAEEAADGSAATDRWKHYKILKEEDIKRLQQKDISAVSGVLSVPRGVACSLLCRNNWCLASAYEYWFAAADDVVERNPDPSVNSEKQQICNICGENTSLPKEVVSAACGHPLCADCWKAYIATAVSDGAGCLTLQCPDPDCRAAVTSDMVENLASDGDLARYEQYLRRSYVESNLNRKWCPAAGCNRAVEFEVVVGSESYDVVCDCSHKFCWRCGEEWHRPAECKAVAEWLEKSLSEAKSTMWILDNTKPCPNCQRPIEKVDGGCNHMTCGAPCEFQFCWMCRAPWEGHGGDPLNICKNYKGNYKGKIIKEERSRTGAKKRLIERYLSYYLGWYSNDFWMKEAMDDLERVRRSHVEMEFVVEAWEQRVECQRVLKWSFVYGYYLPSKHGRKTKLFEFLQAQAKRALGSLNRHLEGFRNYRKEDFREEDLREFRAKLLYSTSVTSKYFKNLLEALENDLPQVETSASIRRSKPI